MVASTSTAKRFVPPPPALLDGTIRLHQFTHQDAQALMRMGIIPEDATTELLFGMIVLKNRAARGQDTITVGHDHAKTVERLSDLRTKINSAVRHVESQQPLICTEAHVPEPDFMVLHGRLSDYSDLPTAADAFCVVEVADASYGRDAGMKLIGYARAGVRHYIIINLNNRTAEVYAMPDAAAGIYPPPQVITSDDELPLRVDQDEFINVPLRDVLP
jgi:hypothetical protein